MLPPDFGVAAMAKQWMTLSAIAILLASSASSQVTTSTTITQTAVASPVVPARDPRAIALLAQCAAAMGNVGPTDPYVAAGQVTYADGQTPAADLVIKGLGSDRVRRELTTAAGQSIWIVNRTVGSANVNGKPQKVPFFQTKYFRPENNPAALCALDVTRGAMNAIYAGLESVGSTPAHHIHFFVATQNQPGSLDQNEPVISDFHLFLDAQSFVVVKTKTFAFSSNAIENRSDWETYYSDYRRVGAVLLPFRLDNFLRGQKLLTLTFTTIRNDVPLSDQDFR
jgi:hypothetical protein